MRASRVKGAYGLTIRLRIGTRKSTMALAQTEEIARQLAARRPASRPRSSSSKTTGDSDRVSKLLPHGGKGGAFVRQIRDAVLDGRLQPRCIR